MVRLGCHWIPAFTCGLLVPYSSIQHADKQGVANFHPIFGPALYVLDVYFEWISDARIRSFVIYAMLSNTLLLTVLVSVRQISPYVAKSGAG